MYTGCLVCLARIEVVEKVKYCRYCGVALPAYIITDARRHSLTAERKLKKESFGCNLFLSVLFGFAFLGAAIFPALLGPLSLGKLAFMVFSIGCGTAMETSFFWRELSRDRHRIRQIEEELVRLPHL